MILEFSCLNRRRIWGAMYWGSRGPRVYGLGLLGFIKGTLEVFFIEGTFLSFFSIQEIQSIQINGNIHHQHTRTYYQHTRDYQHTRK